MNQFLGILALTMWGLYIPFLVTEFIAAAKAAINHPDNEVGDEA